MRSEQLAKFHNDISTLNTHYSHFLFINEQFFLDHNSDMEESPGLLTEEIFSSNQFASQFKVRLEHLRARVEETKGFITRSLFLLSFFHFEIYLKDVYYFAKSLIKDLPELKHKVSVITELQTSINPVGQGFLSQKEMDTADYFHLLRNALVHRDISRISQGDLLDFIKANGKSLNRFWQESPLKLFAWNFTSKEEELTSFSHHKVIDVLNILRRLAERFDYAMMSTIGSDKLQASLVAEFWEKYAHLKSIDDADIKVGKFKHHALLTYGMKYEDADVIKILGE